MKIAPPLPSFRTLHAIHGALTLMVLIGIGYQVHLTARLQAVHEPLLDAVAAITLHATNAHLTGEEFLAGDRDDGTVAWDQLDLAEGYARALLQGGVYRELNLPRITDPAVRGRVEDAMVQLRDLRTLLGRRLAQSSGAGSDRVVALGLRDAFHQTFQAVLSGISEAGDRSRDIMFRERTALLRTQTCFLVGWLIVAVAGAYVLWLLERRNIEAFAAIRRAEGEMRELVRGVESTVEAIVMTDVHGDIFYINPAFTTMSGYEPHEVLGKNPRFLKSGVQPDSLYADLWATILRGDVWVGEITNRRKDGSLYDASVTIAPVVDNNGVVENFVAVQADITERKRTEEALRHLTEVLQEQTDELKRSNEELEQFAYVASHDLQEPLRMVTSFTQLLERRYGDRMDAEGREFIAYAVDGTHRMQALIHALLEYSRVGRRETSRASVDMQQVFDGVIADLGAVICESGATVTCAPLPVVEGDSIQLGQLLQNLVSNALKFRGDRLPVVQVSAERHGEEWELAVRDNGIGIDPVYADRIFVIFQRLHTHDHYQGTGIGLALCKKIVQVHGGRIWVESQSDEGATFHFTLPATMRGGLAKRTLTRDGATVASDAAPPATV